MPTEYVTSEEVQRAVSDILLDNQLTEFSALRDHEIHLGMVLKQKTNAQDEIVESGKAVEVKKVPAHCAPFMESSWVILLDSAVWQQSDATRRRALIHKALMGIEVTGEGRTKARKPDLQEYTATVVRFGPYTPALTSLQDALRSTGRRIAQIVAATAATESREVAEVAEPSPSVQDRPTRRRRPRLPNREQAAVPEEEET